ncbi:aminotransferase class I/II-fold pyridoxal phosphate-dependent enzyme [Paenibacillus sp. 481]|uniref:aminotransferase class I/II-fold pyridoxal phosphate-dependent enzyme n=1 Tax=Paenibacillus sp. 481 TaxID=2835869 RepID=UPI001E593B26|nr:8-amino-7-oxononanoate synthase [Paenibacillus sp. 481]UHA71788.1 8-amino-7-oxononanoate synthase [Paenibacillus sp. 481]
MCPVETDRWDWMREELAERERTGRLRQLDTCTWLENGWMLKGGRRLLNLASNAYLGLNPWLTDADWAALQLACRSAGEPGVRIGSGASRLIAGHDPQHAELEREMAAFKGKEACLVFTSGYMANVGTISALVRRNDVVFSDRLNHASIVDGIVLSRAHHERYPHRDMNRLEQQLKKWSVGGLPVSAGGTMPQRGVRKLVVSDAVFSMDGTKAPLSDLVTLKERYDAILMVDEAHSGGVYGAEGSGLCHALGVQQRVDIMMGTFGKAFGAVGAYVAADDIVIRYLVNAARTFVFNTGLPPMMAALVRTRLAEVRAADRARAELHRKAALFRDCLTAAGLHTGDGDSHIVPLLLGTDARALTVSAALAAAGVAGVAIRPPTVPEGSARIRFAPMAVHRDSDLRRAADEVVRIVREQQHKDVMGEIV